jgi:nicotinamide N-methyltransferase
MSDYAQFAPRTYLEQYYTVITPEAAGMITFIAQACALLPEGARVLEFGAGPTVFTALAAARRASVIDMSEYAEANRAEIAHWHSAAPDAYDWSEYTRRILAHEGVPVTDEAVQQREAATRAAIDRIIACDAHADPPVDAAYATYDAVISSLCLEAAARDAETWRACLARVAALARPGGHIILCTSLRSSMYPVGEWMFDVLWVDGEMMRAGLDAAGCDVLSMEELPPSQPSPTFDGLLFTIARRRV